MHILEKLLFAILEVEHTLVKFSMVLFMFPLVKTFRYFLD